MLASLGLVCCQTLSTKKDLSHERKPCDDQSSKSTQMDMELTAKGSQVGDCNSNSPKKTQLSKNLAKAVPEMRIHSVTEDLESEQFDHSETNNDPLESDTLLQHPDLRVSTNLCIKCGKTFYDKRELKLHEVAIHKEKNMPCRTCSKLFPSVKHRDKHEKTVHATDQAYQCDECPRNYKHPSSLHKHRLSQHRDREARKFKCGFCGKAFITKEKLKTHERTHTGERCHACAHCGMLFTDQSSLARHRKIHEGGTKYQCNLCPKEYS